MATKQMTPKQAEIKRLLGEGKEVGEIARAVKTTAQAVYAQISRMRGQGHLPPSTRATNQRKASRKRGTTKKARREVREAKAEPVSSNGPLPSLDQHLKQELHDVVKRLSEIEGEQAKLTDEQAKLADRRGRLEAADAELHGAAEPAQAAAQPEAPVSA